MTDRPNPPAPEDEAADGPLTLRVGVLVLWIQAALVALLAIVELVQLVRNGTDQFEWAAWIIAGPLVAAVALFFAGWLLINRRLAGRGLAVTIQLCAVPVAFFMITGDNDTWVRIVGALIALSVVAAVALVVAPASRRALVA
ncbi:hypothetical protein [Cryptosporangium arvum]|uniref:hypothetical protein n=1 Tax=Cryptosporangium arvum TaxID=80871 RepID=UPI0004B5F10A|nr:hypothetical protein [Cryptosporangium arvum]